MENHPGKGGAPLEIGFHEDFIDSQDITVNNSEGRNTSGAIGFFPTSVRRRVTGPSPCPSEPSYPTNEMYPESQTFFPPSQAKLGAASKMRRHQSHNTVVPTGPPKPPRDPKRMSG